MPGEEVMIVDDNITNLKLARVLLAAEGYQVVTASDAEEALELLEHTSPQLILMDIQLPGMDGHELTRRIKSRPETQHVIVLALTAYAMKGDELLALEAGCDGYIAKPIDTRTLPAIVAEYLSRSISQP